jgi:spermidine synthase
MVDAASIPNNGGELQLFQRDSEFAIKIKGGQGDLMNSRTHGSEDALGGLGMGFTLATALQSLGPGAQVIVAELVPGVVQWNRDLVGACAGNPLEDDRVTIKDADVGKMINQATKAYDAILLDVDNGPEGLTHIQNDNLYSVEGLHEAYSALRPSGILAVWSATPAPKFMSRLRKVGFVVDERRVRAHQGKGSTHIIWLAKRGR